MTTDITELRQQVADKLTYLDWRLSRLWELDAAALVALAGERLAYLAALATIDAQMGEEAEDGQE